MLPYLVDLGYLYRRMKKEILKASEYETLQVEEPQTCLNLKMYAKETSELLTKDLKVLSLFSGCGGMDLGFEGGFKVFKTSINEYLNPEFIDKSINENEILLKSTRFQTVFANDILKDARNAWVQYFSKKGYRANVFHEESIVDLVKAHKAGEQIFPNDVDVVTGGFPCQDFSLAGKRKGFNSHKDHNGIIRKDDEASTETRGQLYMWMKEVIEITKPKIFIAENVKGLVNLSNVKELIQKDFAAADKDGYFVFEPQVLHAADYGVPQSRERVIFIGVKKSALKVGVLNRLLNGELSQLNPYPAPSHQNDINEGHRRPYVNLKDILNGLVEPEHTKDLSQKYFSKAKFMGKHCQGQTEIKINGIAPTIRSEHHGNIEFRRLSILNGGKNFGELEKGLIERRLTPRECALIQTFPSDFEFVVPSKLNKKKFLISPSQAYKVIGNAVPPLLAYHIANRLQDLWDIYFEPK